MKHIKVGLMLGGGGSKGAYQIGVIKALKEENIMDFVKVISGTSIGAINTMLLMSNPSWERVREIWQLIDNQGVYGQGVKYSPIKHSLVSIEPLYELLKKKVTVKSVHKSNITGYATASLMLSKNLNMLTSILPSTMKEVAFKLNELEDPHIAVMASASIPVLFGITYVNGLPYVDGGAVNNYPMAPLIKEKCNVIWAVAVDARFNPYLYDNTDVTIVDFSAKEAFSRSVVKDLVESVIFTPEMKDEKYALGYFVGKMMISKMKKAGMIAANKDRTYLKRLPDFNVLSLTKDEEKLVKEYRQKLVKQ